METSVNINDNDIVIGAVGIDSMDMSRRFDTITASGDPAGYVTDSLLKDPQKWENLVKLYELSAYYTHHDNIFGSAIKNVLTNFSVTPYRLQGGNGATREKFKAWLYENNFDSLLPAIYYDLYEYGNVYLYLRDDGSIQVLPPHRIKCSELSVRGEPIIGYVHPNTVSSYENKAVKVDDIPEYDDGLPPEIREGKKRGDNVTRLDPEKTFYIGLNKSAWEKYALPLCVNLLSAFKKKNLISSTEDVELSNISKSLLHVRVGDKETRPIPNKREMTAIAKIFATAVTQRDKNLAVTAWNVNAEWLSCSQKETNDLITRKLSWINTEILSGLGLSPIIVAGQDYSYNGSSGNFAQVSANVAIANKRINHAIKNTARVLNDIMVKVAPIIGAVSKRPIKIVFDPCDLSTNDEAQAAILALFDKGLVGYQTVFERLNLDYAQERERRVAEQSKDDATVFFPPAQSYNLSANSGPEGGRPTMDIHDRTSDPDSSASNAIPSPSDVQNH